MVVTPRVCQASRPQTNGNVESTVTSVRRNTIAAGGSCRGRAQCLNTWLEKEMATVTNQQIHGITHKRLTN
jgi:transposase